MSIGKRRDGFYGEKLISIPERVWKEAVKRDPALFRLYIPEIGYFPKAVSHYRDRRKGCEDNIFFYCVHGKGYCLLDNKKFTMEANQFMIIPATDKSIRYWADNNDPWTIYWIHYTGPDINIVNQALNINLLTGPTKIRFSNKPIEIWENIYESLEMGYSKENLTNACFGLYSFLSTFLFSERHMIKDKYEPEDKITKTIMHMRSNLDKKLSIEEMSAVHNLSSSHFSSLFRESTGMPPIDYFIHLKMQKACQLLNLEKAKIKDVAQDLGYDDPYYFSRLFKKIMGVSPEQYKLSSENKQ